jgi:hypothetical protein
MVRITATGGAIAAYVRDYAGKMELMRYFRDAVLGLDPDAAKLDADCRFPLCRPESLEELFASSGLEEVETKSMVYRRHVRTSRMTGNRSSPVRDRLLPVSCHSTKQWRGVHGSL